jgi:glutathione S-transferase
LGKIPVLEHDGFAIPDTSVICRYLDRTVSEKSPDRPADQSLYPRDPQEEARACWLEEYADSRLIENCAGIFQERLLKPKMLNQPTDEARLADIVDNTLPACLTYLESVTPESGYLVGSNLSIADLSVVTCFLQARYGDYEVDPDRFPKVRRYLDQAFADPLVVRRMASEQENMPPGLAD